MSSWDKYRKRKQHEQLKRGLLILASFVISGTILLCCIDVLLRR